MEIMEEAITELVKTTRKAITAVVKLNTVLEQLRSKNGRAYGYYLARSKRAGRPLQYMDVVNKIYLK